MSVSKKWTSLGTELDTIVAYPPIDLHVLLCVIGISSKLQR